MSLKHLLAVGDAGPGDDLAFGMASSLANQHDGVVDIVPIYPDSATDMIALGISLGSTLAPEVVEELAAAERELQRRIEATARKACDRAEIVFGPVPGAPRMAVLDRGLRPALSLSRHAALADLVVFGQGHLEQRPGRDAFDQCLLVERAPVLIARHEADTLSGSVAIAWDGGPQAGRAVRAALPLLAMASEILILQCINGLDRRGADPDITPLNAWLRLHGVGEGTAVLVEGDNAGDALIAAAEGRSAGLLVAGGWGHSRLREAVLGGATRSFLLRKQGPSLLLAH